MSAEIKPYRISIGDDVLDDLKSRLRNARWPEAELVEDWSQGATEVDQGRLPLLRRRN
jgi:epoxide hydrolase